MNRASFALSGLLLLAISCSGSGSGGPTGSGDAAIGTPDASAPLVDAASIDGGHDARPMPECAFSGAPGTCITVSACAALADHTSEPGLCPGPSTIQCCIVTPNVADNPPVPAGYKLMTQAMVTPDMTTWAVMILHDPVTYPMFATTTMMFGTQLVLARVEWHPPDFQNGVIHRGVTLYVPI